MENLILISTDFSVRIIELANYLNAEQRNFPLMGRMLESGTGIGACLRISDNCAENLLEYCRRASTMAVETQYLLELLVKTGYISELQSKPILSDCTSIKKGIAALIGKENNR